VTIPLPQPTGNPVSLFDALVTRRTARDFAGAPLDLEVVAQLLWAAQGHTGPDGRRTAPSAGAQYPLEILVAAGDVTALDAGVYRYDSVAHDLQRTIDDDPRPALHGAALDDQPWLRDAPAVLVVAADMTGIGHHFARQPPAGRRGRRYAYIETGAVCQNVHLQAEALGLGLVLVGGFDDDAVARALNLDERSLEPTALLAIGVRTG
jgi:SagB-type dehydrogenase family enzyme